MNLEELGKRAKAVSYDIAALTSDEKNKYLNAAADALLSNTNDILRGNKEDLERARSNNMAEGLIDRLKLDEKRIAAMAEGLRDVAKLPDPTGGVSEMIKRPNGLLIGKKAVPLGVIGIIYEARPNVTSDAFGLCFKAGNAVILRGGSDALYSNIAVTAAIKSALPDNLKDALGFIEDCDHETAEKFMRLNEYVDVLIPRGSNRLISSVVKNATVPVIETGTGNCHIYVDEYADLEMAIPIIVNAKTQRIGVCNACESLVVHEKRLEEFMPKLVAALSPFNVEIRCDSKAQGFSDADCIKAATDEDWGSEYLDYIISVKSVPDINEAIAHINKYNTGHSESIITSSYENAQLFLDRIDAAAVYVNASTRFTDGSEFGFGAEIGISTQKLHARGPMGLKELTTYKYIVYGNGQIR